MRQRDYWEHELDEIFDFDEEPIAYSSPKQGASFIDDEAEEGSFQEFDCEYGDITMNCSPMNEMTCHLRDHPPCPTFSWQKKAVIISSAPVKLYSSNLLGKTSLWMTAKAFAVTLQKWNLRILTPEKIARGKTSGK